MKTNSKFTLAVHLITVINSNPDKVITSDYFAGRLCCNPVMVRQLYGVLKKAGILRVKTGVGCQLARAAEDISLYDIYLAIEGENAKHIFKFIDRPQDEYFKQFLLPYLYPSADAMMDELKKINIQMLSDDFPTWRAENPNI